MVCLKGGGVDKAVTGAMVEISWMTVGEARVGMAKANQETRGVVRWLGVKERVEYVVAEIVYVVENEK